MIRVVLLVDEGDRGGGRHHVDLLTRAWSKPYAPVRAHVLTMRGIGDLPCIMRSVRGLRAHIVHSHSRWTGVIGRIVGRRMMVPTVHTYHGLHPERWGRAWMMVERRLARWTARLVHVSWSQAAFAETVGLGRAVVVPNGIDHVAIQTSLHRARTRAGVGLGADDFVIGAIGRWRDPVKGLHRLRQVEQVCPTGRILLLGDRAPNLNGRHLQAGWVQYPAHYLPLMDVLASPADAEGMPYAVLESMAAGVPVVATHVRGHTDLVSRETGWLAPLDRFGDVVREAQLAGPEERARRGAYGRLMATSFTADHTAAMLAEVYREVA